VVLEKRWW